MNHNNLSFRDHYLVQSEHIFTCLIDWCLTERFKRYKSTQNQRDWFGTDVVLRILLKGVCDKIAFSLRMYFMDCTLSLLFIRCQIKFTRSCYVLFWNRQCCGIAKFLFKLSVSLPFNEDKIHTTLGQDSDKELQTFLAEPTNISGFPWQNEGHWPRGLLSNSIELVNRVMVNEFQI